MSEVKQFSMKLTDAERIATELLNQVAPYCEIANIAGSIRRKKDEPGILN